MVLPRSEKENFQIASMGRGELEVSTQNWDKIWGRVLNCLKEYNVILSEETLWYRADKFLTAAKKYNNIKSCCVSKSSRYGNGIMVESNDKKREILL